MAAASMVATTSSSSAAPSAAPIDYSKCTNLKACGGMDALVKAAQKEGKLNVITLPTMAKLWIFSQRLSASRSLMTIQMDHQLMKFRQ
jgi:xanthine dehydrogenase iron-sulfur cluster and FAD-binding subunit A